MPSPYAFRRAARSDLPMLLRWRQSPQVLRWWGPWQHPQAEFEAHLCDPAMAMWIVEHDGRPFAYAQDYDCRAWDPHPFSHLPAGSRGVDQYIGEPDMLDRGHGTAFLRLQCERLFAAGVPAIGTDPNPENARAIRAYEKAGFAVVSGPVETRWGRAILMERWWNGASSHPYVKEAPRPEPERPS